MDRNKDQSWRSNHTVDPVTYNCTACGATYEAMLDGVAKVCLPDGHPHPRLDAQFDVVAA